MKIANLAYTDDVFSHDYYRAYLPFLEFGKYGVDVRLNPDDDFLDACDLVNVFTLHDGHPQYQRAIRYKGKKPIIAQMGDDHKAAGRLNLSANGWTRRTTERIYDSARALDFICTTTEALAKRMRFLARPTFVMENVIVPHAYRGTFGLDKIKENDPLRLFYMGSPSHKGDLNSILSALSEVMRERKELIFCCYGILPFGVLSFKEFSERIQIAEFTSINDYFLMLLRFNPDVCVIPLTTRKFNGGKSNLKFLEMAAGGTAIVVSDHPVYSNIARHEENCLVARSQKDWKGHVLRLLDDRVLRRRLAQTALDDVTTRYSVSSKTEQYVELYKGVLELWK